jgi:hypothetical protein
LLMGGGLEYAGFEQWPRTKGFSRDQHLAIYKRIGD